MNALEVKEIELERLNIRIKEPEKFRPMPPKDSLCRKSWRILRHRMLKSSNCTANQVLSAKFTKMEKHAEDYQPKNKFNKAGRKKEQSGYGKCRPEEIQPVRNGVEELKVRLELQYLETNRLDRNRKFNVIHQVQKAKKCFLKKRKDSLRNENKLSLKLKRNLIDGRLQSVMRIRGSSSRNQEDLVHIESALKSKLKIEQDFVDSVISLDSVVEDNNATEKNRITVNPNEVQSNLARDLPINKNPVGNNLSLMPAKQKVEHKLLSLEDGKMKFIAMDEWIGKVSMEYIIHELDTIVQNYPVSEFRLGKVGCDVLQIEKLLSLLPGPSLHVVALNKLEISKSSVETIADALQYTMHTLYVTNMIASQDVCTLFIIALRRAVGLLQLDLSHNQLCMDCIPTKLQTLTHLNLSWNTVSENAVNRIANAVHDQECPITYLNLSGTSLHPAARIALLLDGRVQELHLTHNHIQESTIMIFMERLYEQGNTTTLKTLHLDENPLGPNGAIWILRYILSYKTCTLSIQNANFSTLDRRADMFRNPHRAGLHRLHLSSKLDYIFAKSLLRMDPDPHHDQYVSILRYRKDLIQRYLAKNHKLPHRGQLVIKVSPNFHTIPKQPIPPFAFDRLLLLLDTLPSTTRPEFVKNLTQGNHSHILLHIFS